MAATEQTITVTASLPSGWEKELETMTSGILSRTKYKVGRHCGVLVELPRWKRAAHAIGRWLVAL